MTRSDTRVDAESPSSPTPERPDDGLPRFLTLRSPGLKRGLSLATVMKEEGLEKNLQGILDQPWSDTLPVSGVVRSRSPITKHDTIVIHAGGVLELPVHTETTVLAVKTLRLHVPAGSRPRFTIMLKHVATPDKPDKPPKAANGHRPPGYRQGRHGQHGTKGADGADGGPGVSPDYPRYLVLIVESIEVPAGIDITSALHVIAISPHGGAGGDGGDGGDGANGGAGRTGMPHGLLCTHQPGNGGMAAPMAAVDLEASEATAQTACTCGSLPDPIRLEYSPRSRPRSRLACMGTVVTVARTARSAGEGAEVTGKACVRRRCDLVEKGQNWPRIRTRRQMMGQMVRTVAS